MPNDALSNDDYVPTLSEQEVARLEKYLKDLAEYNAKHLPERIKTIQKLLKREYISGNYDDITADIDAFVGKAFDSFSDNGKKSFTVTDEDGQIYLIHEDGSISSYTEDAQTKKPSFTKIEGHNVKDIKHAQQDKKGHPAVRALVNTYTEQTINDAKLAADGAYLHTIFKNQDKVLKDHIKDFYEREKLINGLKTVKTLSEGKKTDQHYTPEKEIASRLKDAGINPQGLDFAMLATLLWNNEESRRVQVDHPHYGSLIHSVDNYPDFHFATAMRDVVGFAVGGKVGNTLRAIQPESDIKIDDRFFTAAFYELVHDNHNHIPATVDGALLGPEYAGETLTREDVQAIALRKLKEAAVSNSVAAQDITAAMYEGRFNPYFTDLMMAYDGLGDPAPDALSHPENFDLSQRMFRNKEWNSLFGSLENLDAAGQTVNMFKNGKQVTATAKDIALHHYMRVIPGMSPGRHPALDALFENRFDPKFLQAKYPALDMATVFGEGGVPLPENLTYAQAERYLKAVGNEATLADINKEIKNSFENHSVVTYFINSSNNNPEAKFDFRRDYQEARKYGHHARMRHEEEVRRETDNDPNTKATDGYIATRDEDTRKKFNDETRQRFDETRLDMLDPTIPTLHKIPTPQIKQELGG